MDTTAIIAQVKNGASLSFTKTVDGKSRTLLSSTLDWAALSSALRKHDVQSVYSSGTLTFGPMPATQAALCMPVPKTSCVVGPLRTDHYTDVSCTNQELDAFLAQADTLNVTLTREAIVVTRICPTDIQDGLSHLHRRGLVTYKQKRAVKRETVCRQSVAGKRSILRVGSRRGIRAQLQRWLGQ